MSLLKRVVVEKLAEARAGKKVSTGFIAGKEGYGMPTVSFGERPAETSYVFPDEPITASASKQAPAIKTPVLAKMRERSKGNKKLEARWLQQWKSRQTKKQQKNKVTKTPRLDVGPVGAEIKTVEGKA